MDVSPGVTRRAAVGTGMLFASNGALFASLLPWYPMLADRLSLSPGQFGLVVACYAVGAVASSAVPPRLIARWGPVPVSVVGSVVLAVAIAAVAWVPSGAFFALALFGVGVADAVVDVAQNVAGVRVQDAAGRSVLSSMHALWSLGGMVAGAAATASAAARTDMRLHLVVVAVVGIVLVAVGGRLIGRVADSPPDGAGADAPTAAGHPRWRPALVLAVPLVAVAVCGTVVEDVANNWAGVSGVRLAGLDADVAGIAFTVAIGSQCVGRFTGDLLIGRRGPARGPGSVAP
jgi:MFS family permease